MLCGSAVVGSSCVLSDGQDDRGWDDQARRGACCDDLASEGLHNTLQTNNTFLFLLLS